MRSPLSQSQLGIYYACKTSVNEFVNYQSPALFTFPKGIDLQRIQQAVYDALAAHPYLMSRIEEDADGVPYTIDGLPIKVDMLHVSEDEWKDAQNTFARTMDLYGVRLYRAEIYIVENHKENYLYLDFHHVLSDGFTMVLMVKDIERIYNGKKPSREMLDGAAVAQAELEQREDETLMNEARQWYSQEFANAAETESVPIPESRNTDIPSDERVQKEYQIDVTKEEMQMIAKRFGISEDTVSGAAWALMLAAYGAEDKAAYCTAFWGRTDRRTLTTAAMMVHTLPVFVQVSGEMKLEELFARFDSQTQQTRKYQYYAYPDAVRDLGLNCQVMFVYQGTVLSDKRVPLFDGIPAGFADMKKASPGWKLSAELFNWSEQYSLKMVYAAADYSDEYMQQLARCYSAILRSMVNAEYVRDLEYCDAGQMAWLDKRNPSETLVLPEADGLVTRFKQRVAEHPDAVCVVAGDKRLTYAEVDRLTDAIDPTYTTPCGEHAIGYTVPRNEQMVLVPLSIAKAGKTLLPLDSSYPPERLEYMKQDAAQCKNSEAFVLLYTSGTTGEPKGVMLSERNVLSFCDYHCRYFDINGESRSATYAGYGFDAFQQDLWAALISGAALYILPDEIRFDLEAMHAYFDEQGITHAFMTTQVATQMAINYPEMQTLKVLGTGGEKLMSINPPKTYHLYNGYGPTESIAYVCSYIVDHKEPNIPIGFANDTSRLYVVNKYGKRVPWGAAGELLVAGEQIGLGYLNKPDKTAEAFIQWNDERVYRTGDVVRYRQDGALEFVGRRDGQVKIRGFRIELKEVEGVIREYPGIKDATVQAFDYPSGGKFIAAYVVSDGKVDIQALNEFIMDRKPPYMVPAVTMQIDAIPLNQNQKVNKRALPEPKTTVNDSDSEAKAPLNLLEQELHDMVAQIVNSEDFSITTDLRLVGLSSISAIKLATQVFKRYHIQLDAKQLTKGITIQAIENAVLASLLSPQGEVVTSAQPSPQPAWGGAEEAATPLSYAQTGVYFECMKNPTSTLYNIPMRLLFPTDISNDALCQAVKSVVDNHPELHVRFKTNETGVVQQVERGEWNVEELQLTEEQAEAYKTDFVCPFNLNNDMLCRFAIVRTENRLYLYCDMHHLVCDGASYDIFIHELCALLDGQPLEPETCTFAQFVSEQKAAEGSESFMASAQFFQSQLSNVDGVTELSSDLITPKAQSETAYVSAPIDWKVAEQLAQAQGVTPAALSLAAVSYTLARFTNSDDVCITTISNGRSNLRISNTMGMFVNTLALTANIGQQSVADFIQQTAQSFEQTLAHEDYPFARIAADYNLSADIMFAYQMGVLSQYKVHGQTVQAENMELNVPKFKISFYIMEVEGTPSVAIEYDNGCYSQAMMQSLAQSVSNALLAFAQAPEAALRSVSLTNEAQLQVLDSFNDSDRPYDDTQTVVSLFRRQAKSTPDAEAVVFKDHRYTYAEVDDISDRIAGYILSKGLGVGDAVSIIIPRCEWMVIASIGILKAGCAYQPLDSSYPKERLNFMVKDADAKLLIADESLRDLLDEYDGEILLTKELLKLPPLTAEACAQLSAVGSQLKPSSRFILLYTSGSTGVPKGCQLTHGNLVCYCNWYWRYYDLKPEHNVAEYASYGFDVHQEGIYPPLTGGSTVHIIPEELRLDLMALNEYLEREHITHTFMTTQVGYQFATNIENHSLLHMSVAGEKLASIAPPHGYLLHNGYGPTEATILISIYPVTRKETDVPIGKPLDNVRLYVVDQQGHRLPMGAMGELWAAGPQVALGYLNRPDKNAEVFIQNPFTTEEKYIRAYRTGDIVRYLPSGDIQFVGRRDGQMKIRGFRIELKEVEAVIREYPGIKDATVQAFDYPNGGKFIAAYVVSDEKVDIQALHAFIKERKPPYMVPAATMQIDAIPLNQNQKVNKRVLPVPQLTTEDRTYVAPKGETETLLCDIFASILSLDKVGATDNFFELGGTSLMVIRVIIEAGKAGKHFAYADLFSHPTPRQLAAMVDGQTPAEDVADTTITDYDYASLQELLSRNTLETFSNGAPRELGHVLLTGATGYLGIHVLNELLDSDAKSITCLVRGKDQPDAERRLRRLLFYYFSRRFDDLFGVRLFVVNGDVTAFDEATITQSANGGALPPIDTVINCAANVKHFSQSTDIEDVNIGGAQCCVDFCLKTGAMCVHVSTTSIGGLWVGDKALTPVLTERSIYFGQDLSNQYMHSKFLAERIILDAVIHKGLKAKILRVGNLAARSYDGEFQVNFSTNSYMGRIKIFNMLGCCPFDHFDQPTEFSPVDETARAIVLLARTPDGCTVFHPYNNHTRLLGDVLAGLEKIGTPIRFVEQQEFGRYLQQAALDPAKASQLTTMLAYQGSANSKPTYIVESNNRYTSQVLLRLGFRWTEPDSLYVNRMLTAISQLGFFD